MSHNVKTSPKCRISINQLSFVKFPSRLDATRAPHCRYVCYLRYLIYLPFTAIGEAEALGDKAVLIYPCGLHSAKVLPACLFIRSLPSVKHFVVRCCCIECCVCCTDWTENMVPSDLLDRVGR